MKSTWEGLFPSINNFGIWFWFFSRPWLLKFNHHANASATHHTHKMGCQPSGSLQPYMIRVANPRRTSPPPRQSWSTRSVTHSYAHSHSSGQHDWQFGLSRSAPQGSFVDCGPIQLDSSAFSETATGYYPLLPPLPLNIAHSAMSGVVTGYHPSANHQWST